MQSMQVDKAPEGNDLDVSAAARGIWLVKVPKYLSERWHNAENNDKSMEVGKLHIAPSKLPGGKQEVIFSLKPDLAANAGPEAAPCPLDHKFIMSSMGTQNFSVLSQTYPPPDSLPSEAVDKVAVEGRITHRAECQPIADAKYMQLKRKHMLEQNKPKREIKQLDTIVVNYKPVSDHKFNLETKQQKQTGKRCRDDEEIVKERLFAAFEKHQYYYLKDLERITKQPTKYLKDILKEMCTYNLKAPYRNMWELKPEFRYYKNKDGADS